jgi:small GTP-binding protein
LISKKVILTGSFGVGKSSLFHRFIENTFDGKYLTTVGVKVNNRTIEVDGVSVNILLWDIAGEARQNKVPPAYFLGTSGIIFVFDLTRPATREHIEHDMKYLRGLLPFAEVKLVGNKSDLLTPEQIEAVIEKMDTKPHAITSAKTGDQVEELFHELAKAFL